MACPCRFYFVRPEDGGISVVLCACLARDNADKEPSTGDSPRSARHEAWVNSIKAQVAPGSECIDITEADLPQNRVFRNAWAKSGKRISIDPTKAKEIHLFRIRKAREREMVKLDAEWMRATGKGRKAEADAIEAKRENLRNAPQDAIVALANLTDPDAIHAFWPESLGERDMSVPE